MSEAQDKLYRRIGYRFSDPHLLQTALTHRSRGSCNNERLEFLGDAVLSVIIAEALYERFPEADEGALSRLRAGLVRGETLAAKARSVDLGEALLLGPGELKSGGFRRDSILAGALEAIIGAVYIEGGLSAARNLILSMFSDELKRVSLKRVGKDAKTRLQEYLQARHLPLPVYRVLNVEGRDHAQLFRVRCAVDGLTDPVDGVGGSRRKAEQDAAAKVLERLQDSGR